MVILNRIVNILILLAAIAAVVFSYLLFSKREKLVNGWAQMATAINTAAKTLDDGGSSGITAARDLTEEKLKHENYENLGTVLPKLKENTGKIVTQRNELANVMQEAAKRLNIKNVEGKNLKSVTAYRDQANIFSNGVKNYREHRNNLSEQYAETFRKLGASSISRELLNDPEKYKSAIVAGNLKADDVVKRKNKYASCLNNIANALRLRDISKSKIDGDAYERAVNRIFTEVRAKIEALETAQRQLAAEKGKNERLNRNLTSRIKRYNEETKRMKKEIEDYKNKLTNNGSIELPKKMLTASDPECYKEVHGVVEYVDKDYGFIQINIGRSYSFVQPYGTVKNRVHFPLKTGRTMSVVRGSGHNKQFIGKVIVTKVDENSSICNLVGGHPELYQEGDSVCFTDEDVAQALSSKKK